MQIKMMLTRRGAQKSWRQLLQSHLHQRAAAAATATAAALLFTALTNSEE
ncbi:WSSV356 [White spot syndrome virus]|uniref:WSSV356 n=1 Tax=White spot syndrome virus TaxID=342409 RepID=A0A2I6SC60_9VIRU|nr:WSSV356 [White spot syndrome virus]